MLGTLLEGVVLRGWFWRGRLKVQGREDAKENAFLTVKRLMLAGFGKESFFILLRIEKGSRSWSPTSIPDVACKEEEWPWWTIRKYQQKRTEKG